MLQKSESGKQRNDLVFICYLTDKSMLSLSVSLSCCRGEYSDWTGKKVKNCLKFKESLVNLLKSSNQKNPSMLLTNTNLKHYRAQNNGCRRQADLNDTWEFTKK